MPFRRPVLMPTLAVFAPDQPDDRIVGANEFPGGQCRGVEIKESIVTDGDKHAGDDSFSPWHGLPAVTTGSAVAAFLVNSRGRFRVVGTTRKGRRKNFIYGEKRHMDPTDWRGSERIILAIGGIAFGAIGAYLYKLGVQRGRVEIVALCGPR
jgi:hypothetical protein